MGGINGVDPYQYQQYALSNQFGMNVGGVGGGVTEVQGTNTPKNNPTNTVPDEFGNLVSLGANGTTGLCNVSQGEGTFYGERTKLGYNLSTYA